MNIKFLLKNITIMLIISTEHNAVCAARCHIMTKKWKEIFTVCQQAYHWKISSNSWNVIFWHWQTPSNIAVMFCDSESILDLLTDKHSLHKCCMLVIISQCAMLTCRITIAFSMLSSSDGRPSDFQISCSLSVLKNLYSLHTRTFCVTENCKASKIYTELTLQAAQECRNGLVKYAEHRTK